MSLYIGIEGVGMRQSFAVASDRQGNILSAVRMPTGISLHSTPRDELRSRLLMLLRSVTQEAQMTFEALEDATICIGLTGVTFPYDAKVDLVEEFNQLQVKVKKLVCTGDVEIIFASHTFTDQGSAIVCHMGSTAYVATPKATIRFGGWGPAIGDEGSGYWMGRSSLRAVGEEHDMKLCESQLWKEIKAWLSNPDKSVPEWIEASIIWKRITKQFKQKDFDVRTAVFAFCQEICVRGHWLWRSVASSLTTPLIRAFDQGDPVAKDILEGAAFYLVTQLDKASKVAEFSLDQGPLVLYGGVLTHHVFFQKLVLSKIHKLGSFPSKVLTPYDDSTMRPVCGALLFALGGSETGHLRLPKSDVIRQVFTDTKKNPYRESLTND